MLFQRGETGSNGLKRKLFFGQLSISIYTCHSLGSLGSLFPCKLGLNVNSRLRISYLMLKTHACPTAKKKKKKNFQDCFKCKTGQTLWPKRNRITYSSTWPRLKSKWRQGGWCLRFIIVRCHWYPRVKIYSNQIRFRYSSLIWTNARVVQILSTHG